SITSSARASSVGGISRPSALAVLRLMASSNFVGCSIGRSAGFAPLITLRTNAVARLVKSGILAPYEISPPSATDSLDSYIAGSRCIAARLLICRLAEKKLCVGQEAHGIEAVRFHGGEHCRELVEARNDEQTKLQSKCRTNRLEVIP